MERREHKPLAVICRSCFRVRNSLLNFVKVSNSEAMFIYEHWHEFVVVWSICRDCKEGRCQPKHSCVAPDVVE